MTKGSIRKGTVALGYVHPAEVSVYFHQSVVKTVMADALGPRRIISHLPKYSSANISNARNAIVRTFLDETQAEWLWFVDADMHWDPEALDTLLDYADEHRAPVVGGLCFGIEDGILFPTLYAWGKNDDDKITSYRYDSFPENAMFQVGATGAAFLLIHRKVLVAIRDKGFNPTFPWFQETEMAGAACGEDVTFCARAGILGYPVYVHTGVEVGHHKSFMLTADMYAGQRADKEAERGLVHGGIPAGPEGPAADPVGGSA